MIVYTLVVKILEYLYTVVGVMIVYTLVVKALRYLYTGVQRDVHIDISHQAWIILISYRSLKNSKSCPELYILYTISLTHVSSLRLLECL